MVQELYEKKLVTYPRTDARVLSSAVAREIQKNIRGLTRYEPASGFASEILEKEAYRNIGKSRYTNDKQITDHYASSLRARDCRISPGSPSFRERSTAPLSGGF